MQAGQLRRLEAMLEAAAAHLPNVTMKRLFGCQALYRTKAVFALVWKTGRIGVKLPLTTRHQELMSLAGAEPWVAHAVMSQWVLVPKSFHDDSRLLFKWLKVAYVLADDEAGTGHRAKSTPKPKMSGRALANSITKTKSKAKPRKTTTRTKKTNPR